jgi:hypothetical protein
MTLQEMFDTVWERAKTPIRCVDDDGRCMYRGAGGGCCFIGALIPDDRYDPGLEYTPVDISNGALLAASGISRAYCGVALELQTIHDEIDPQDWASHLRGIARRYGLRVPE